MNSTRRKIAIVTPFGAESRYDWYPESVLAHGLFERGWAVRMHTYAIWSKEGYRHDVNYKGVPVYRCRQRLGFSPRLLFSILWWRPDAVVCFHPKSYLNFTAFIAARLIGAPFIVEIVGILHDSFIVNDVDDPEHNLKHPIRLATRFSLYLQEIFAGRFARSWTNYVCHMPIAHADAIIAISDDEKKYIQQIYGRDSTRIYMSAPRGEDTTQSKPVAEIPAKYLFFIGQIKRRKGWDTAIDALAALRARGIEKQLVFVCPNKDIADALAYAKERRVSDLVTFLIAVSNAEKNWLYAHCQYVLIPSRYESFGIPVFESFVARKPILATQINVFMEFLEDRHNAMLTPVGNGIAMANAILELDRNPALQATLIEGGEKTAERFSYARTVDEHESVIKEAIHARLA